MYVEDANGNSIGIIGKQQADTIASKIEADREKGREFLRQMGEEDSEEAVNALIDEHKGK